MSKCEHCGEPAADLNEDNVCGECESAYFVYCDVCRKGQHEENLCRHLFWCDGHGWAGCGYAEVDRDRSRLAVWTLCRHLDEQRVLALRDALRAGTFYFQFRGPMLGRASLYAWLGRVRLADFDFLRDVEEKLPTLPEKEQALLKEAVGWLVSLWSGGQYDRERQTKVWDDKTADWIDDYLGRIAPALAAWAGEWVVRKAGPRVTAARLKGERPARTKRTDVARVVLAIGEDVQAGDVVLCKVGKAVGVHRVLKRRWEKHSKPVLLVPAKTGGGVRRVRHTDVYARFVPAAKEGGRP
jgi:hypothetical protein